LIKHLKEELRDKEDKFHVCATVVYTGSSVEVANASTSLQTLPTQSASTPMEFVPILVWCMTGILSFVQTSPSS